MKKKTDTEIFRYQVPKDDPAVYEWSKAQGHNLSISVRVLIQREIRKNGIRNMFATSPIEPDMPEPRKKEKKAEKSVSTKTVPSSIREEKQVSSTAQTQTQNKSQQAEQVDTQVIPPHTDKNAPTASDINNFLV